MRIIDDIKGILANMVTDGEIKSTLYQVPSKANERIEFVAEPCGILFCVPKGVVDISKGNIAESATIALEFVAHQPQLAFDGTLNESLVDTMRLVGYSFINRLRALDGYSLSDTIEVRTIFDKYDANTTGVSLQFEIKDKKTKCIKYYEYNQQNQDEDTPIGTDNQPDGASD